MEKAVANTIFLRICRSQLRALLNYLQLKQTICLHLFSFRNLHAGSMVPDLAYFALFLAHDHESVRKTNYFFLFCGIKIVDNACLVID